MTKKWLRPMLSAQPFSHVEVMDALVESGAAVDVSSQPALWGMALRGVPNLVMARTTLDWTHLTNSGLAVSQVQAALIQALCSVGRERLDLFALPFSRSAPCAQAVLDALGSAKAEGHVGELAGIGNALDWELTGHELVAPGRLISVIEVWTAMDVRQALAG